MSTDSERLFQKITSGRMEKIAKAKKAEEQRDLRCATKIKELDNKHDQLIALAQKNFRICTKSRSFNQFLRSKFRSKFKENWGESNVNQFISIEFEYKFYSKIYIPIRNGLYGEYLSVVLYTDRRENSHKDFCIYFDGTSLATAPAVNRLEVYIKKHFETPEKVFDFFINCMFEEKNKYNLQFEVNKPTCVGNV